MHTNIEGCQSATLSHKGKRHKKGSTSTCLKNPSVPVNTGENTTVQLIISLHQMALLYKTCRILLFFLPLENRNLTWAQHPYLLIYLHSLCINTAQGKCKKQDSLLPIHSPREGTGQVHLTGHRFCLSVQ